MHLRSFAFLACALALQSAPARAAEGAELPRSAWTLQATTGVVTGLLAGGYVFGALELLDVRTQERTIVGLAPAVFGIGAGLGVWLGGRWSGLDGELGPTFFAAAVPGVVGALLSVVLSSLRFRDAAIWPVLLTPIVSVVTSLAAFEYARPTGAPPPVRAVADERTP